MTECFLLNLWSNDTIEEDQVLDLAQEIENEGINLWLSTHHKEESNAIGVLNELKSTNKIIFNVSTKYLESLMNENEVHRSFDLAVGKGLDNFVFITFDDLSNREEWELNLIGRELCLSDRFIFDFSSVSSKEKYWNSFLEQLTEHETDLHLNKRTNVNEFKFDAYLSHNWQRNGHSQMLAIAKKLRKKGLELWIDEEQIRKSVTKDIVKGITNSKKIVIFLNEGYIESSLSRQTQTGKELRVALLNKSEDIVLVLLNQKTNDSTKWPWILKETLSCATIYDLSSTLSTKLFYENFLQELMN